MFYILKTKTKQLFLYDLFTKTDMPNLELAKSPSDCTCKEEIRQQIDVIDKEIIALFAKRFEYVSEIVKFKNDIESVVAQDRKDQVIRERGEWAEKHGLDKNTFEQIYRFLVDHNIGKELEVLNNR